MADSDMLDEVKSLTKTLNTVHEEFKQVNNRIEAMEKKGNVADPMLKEKLEKLDAVLADSATRKDELLRVKSALARLASSNGNVALLDDENTDAKATNEAKAAYNLYLRKGIVAGEASTDGFSVKSASAIERKAMSVISDPDGGYTVTADMSGRVIKKIFETSPFRAYANSQTISSDALEGLYDNDEAGAGWVGETQARPETTTPQLGKYRIPVHEMYANPAVTQKLLDDSSLNIESWLSDKVGRKFGRMENTAFLTGDGVAKPRGILTYPAGTNQTGQLQQIVSGSNGLVTADTIIDLMFSIKSSYLAGSIFGANRMVIAQLRKLKDGQGNYLWSPGFNGGSQSTVLGYGIVDFPDMPVPATDALALFFGNLSEAYQIVDRIGLRVLRDPFTNKPYIHFYTTKRVGGDVVNFEAIKLYKQGT